MVLVCHQLYHSYYYDTETGFYYLQSRYYDPVIHRFINADAYTTTNPTDAISYNMFKYCNNNPVNCYDPTGKKLVSVMSRDGGGGGAFVPLLPNSAASERSYREFTELYKEITGNSFIQFTNDQNYFKEVGTKCVHYSVKADKNYIHAIKNPTIQDIVEVLLQGALSGVSNSLPEFGTAISIIEGIDCLYSAIRIAHNYVYPDEIASGIPTTKYEITYSWDTNYGKESYTQTYVICSTINAGTINHYIYTMYASDGDRGYCIYPN